MAFQYVSTRSSAYNFFCLLMICEKKKKIKVMDFALNILLMGFAEGMTIVYGVLAVIASIMLLWLKSKWGQKWLDSLD